VRLLVFEAVTGGGMVRDNPSPGLIHEADLMVRTLLGELRLCDGVSIVTTRDYRLPPVDAFPTTVIDRLQDPHVAFDLVLQSADAAWVVAPETGGELERLARLVTGSGKALLGCTPDAIAIAASKRATAELLAAAGIPVVPTFARADEIPPLPGLWMVKPDDGAGAEGALRCWDHEAALERMRPGYVAQPWIEGDPLSLSLLCGQGGSRLLSVNRQKIRIVDDRIELAGITVNAMTDPDGRFAALGQQVARAMPGLFGWVGVDLIAADGELIVLEVNPRLTTSYCGVAQARGINTAALVLELFRTGMLPDTSSWPVGTPYHLDLRLPDAG
jgi:predicted ATP-grasp superfamily ATP-dependent carboligase